jgi:hypothetical protein
MDRLFGQGVEVSAENMLDVFPELPPIHLCILAMILIYIF